MAGSEIEIGHLYTVPSGLGGAFTVQALAVSARGLVDCRVYMPLNPDWHGYLVTARAVEMQPSAERRPPRRGGFLHGGGRDVQI